MISAADLESNHRRLRWVIILHSDSQRMIIYEKSWVQINHEIYLKRRTTCLVKIINTCGLISESRFPQTVHAKTWKQYISFNTSCKKPKFTSDRLCPEYPLSNTSCSSTCSCNYILQNFKRYFHDLVTTLFLYLFSYTHKQLHLRSKQMQF